MRKRRVLVVDDSQHTIKTLSKLLEKNDCEVVGSATNGFEAVRVYRAEKPDFLTLDIIMPQMGGLQTLQLLMRIDPQVKVIMVSSINDKEKIVECIKIGAVHYVLKPFDEEAVVAAIEKIPF